jgi:hypothetical protein
MIFLVEKSDTGGEWSCQLDVNLDFTAIYYNGQPVTQRIKGTWMEEVLWQFFEERNDLERLQREQLYRLRQFSTY